MSPHLQNFAERETLLKGQTPFQTGGPVQGVPWETGSSRSSRSWISTFCSKTFICRFHRRLGEVLGDGSVLGKGDVQVPRLDVQVPRLNRFSSFELDLTPCLVLCSVTPQAPYGLQHGREHRLTTYLATDFEDFKD
jgi:hypothetical protein